MIKEAIYTFKKLKHYKPFDETFFRLAKLSIYSAEQFYTTVLYTDNNSLEFLTNGGLKFDRVVLLDSIEEYKGGNYAMPKILTMISREEPYIHLDFDSILIDKPESKAQVSFPFPEPDLTKLTTHTHYEFVYIAYVKCFVEHIMDQIEYEKQSRIKWNIFPNNSALLVNNPKTISDIFTEIITEFVPDKIEVLNPTAIEQQYFLSHLEYYGIEYDFRNTTDTFSIIEYKTLSDKKKQYYLDKQKYVHISHYAWWPDITDEILNFFNQKLNLIEKKTIL